MVNTFGREIVPENDELRLGALYRYQLLDTPPEEAFTNLAYIIADVFDVPIALISLVDRDRVFFKGNIGMPGVKSVDRGMSLCSLAILSDQPTIISNTLEDPCLLANPLVHGEFGLRFYAGAPIVTPDGFNIGTVCIVDKQARSFSKKEQERLVRFSKMAMHEIELRLAAKKQKAVQEELQKAQTQLNAALAAGKVTTWHWDIVNNLVYGEAELAHIFGVDPKEAANGLPVEVFVKSIHEEDQGYVWSRINHSLQTGEDYEAEYRVINHENIVRWAIGRGRLQYDSYHNPVGLTGILIDITEKKEAENVLKYRTAVLEAQNEATSEGVLIVDPQGKMLSYNSRFVQMWGFPNEIMESKNDAAALQYATTLLVDPDNFIRRVSYLYAHPSEKSFDEIHFKDGRVFDRYGSAVVGKDGTYYGWAWYFKDITDRKKAEEEIRLKSEALHKLNQELQFVTDTMPQLVWATEPDGYAYFFNNGWYRYTGLKYEQLEGHNWIHTLHPDDLERTLSVWKNARETGGIYEVEYRLKSADGTYRWFLARGTPMRDDKGNIIKWYGSTTDIHDQKTVAEALEIRVKERTADLEHQRNLLDNVLKHSPSGITVYKAIRNNKGEVVDFICIVANDAAENFTGIPKEERFTRTVLELTPGLKGSELFDMTVVALEKGTPLRTEYFHERNQLWLEFSVVKMDNEHLINVFRDITPIKEANLLLQKHVEDLKRTNADLEHFTYAASHDLKEPIRKIRVFADRLKSSLHISLTDEQNRFLDRLDAAAMRMSHLIEDLLAYSQVGLKPQLSDKVDMDYLISQVLKDLDLEIEEKGAKIYVDQLFVTYGHKRQLHQAFLNLLSNALKYTKPGTPPEISIRYRKVLGLETGLQLSSAELYQEYHQIEVNDNGIGFNQKDAGRIFNVFQRLHGNTDYRGTGLGLSIVRKAVENHNGFVTATAEPEQGASFRVLLPVNNLSADEGAVSTELSLIKDKE